MADVRRFLPPATLLRPLTTIIAAIAVVSFLVGMVLGLTGSSPAASTGVRTAVADAPAIGSGQPSATARLAAAPRPAEVAPAPRSMAPVTSPAPASRDVPVHPPARAERTGHRQAVVAPRRPAPPRTTPPPATPPRAVPTPTAPPAESARAVPVAARSAAATGTTAATTTAAARPAADSLALERAAIMRELLARRAHLDSIARAVESLPGKPPR